jgi:PAS domain S-box-containing protein
MHRMAISQWSIVTKLTLIVLLIFILVGGILAVNTISFFQVKDSLVSMIDRDAGQIIENSRFTSELNDVFANAHSLIHQFPERQKTLKADKQQLVEILQSNIKLLERQENNLHPSLKNYTQRLATLLDQCISINAILSDSYRIEQALDHELATLDEIVVEKELVIANEKTEENQALKQLGLMLPAYREIYFEMMTQLLQAKHAYIGEKVVNKNYEKQILSLLDEFHTGLSATTVAWKEIIPRFQNLIRLSEQFKQLITKLFTSLREFHESFGILERSQTKLITEIGVLNKEIAANTKHIRLKTADYLTAGIRTTLLLSAIIVAILISIGFFTVRIVRPIKRLNIGVKKVGSGYLNYKVKIDSKDEIGQLAESFNQMTEDLQNTTVSKEYVENIFSSMIDTLIVVTPEGKIQVVNQATCDLLGYQAEELIDQPLEKILGSEAVADEKEQIKIKNTEIQKLIQNGFVREIERVYMAKDGAEIPVLFSRSVMRDTAGQIQGIVCFAVDITDRKLAEAALRESEQKLARSKKMETVGLMAGGIAHDLNNILSGIVSYPDLILMDLPEKSPLREPIECIQDSGNRAAAVVSDLLTVAKGVATGKETLNLNTIIEEYTLSAEHRKLEAINPAIDFKLQLDANLFNTECSPSHITKSVLNLVTNATEAIQNGGSVTVSTMNRYLDTPLNGYEDMHQGEYAVLAVSDSGPGISPVDRERIFEPFYTKKVMGRIGTGLGLAVVWNTVQDHGGFINLTSDKNGTLFELYFPVTRTEVAADVEPVSINNYTGKGEKILVVDDEAMQRAIASSLLIKLGYLAEVVSSGEEAVEYLKTHSVDLIMLDMIMFPGMNGCETYKRIIKIHPKQKSIIASGFAETEEVKTAQKLGAGKYIKKPYTLEALGLALKEELTKEHF